MSDVTEHVHEDDMSGQGEGTVLTVPNLHIKGCGAPPNLMAGGHVYTGYFENDYGEQLVYQYDRQKKVGTLWHGDCEWEPSYKVVDGQVPELVLSREECLWLMLVWSISTGVRP